MRLILLKNPSGKKATVKKTTSDVSPGHSNRLQTKLARKTYRHFSYIFAHLQEWGVLKQNLYGWLTAVFMMKALGTAIRWWWWLAVFSAAAGESGIVIERDVPAVMRDGVVLRADVHRPDGGGP